MNKLISLIAVSLLVGFSAWAQAPENDITGAEVGLTGFGCTHCQESLSVAPIAAGVGPSSAKGYDSLLPDSGSSGDTSSDGAKGTK